MEYSSKDYYDIYKNKTFTRGHDNTKEVESKHLIHPNIFESVYTVSKDGYIYSIMEDSYIKWDYIDKYPSVILLTKEKGFIKKRFYVKDLVACSYIANANDYLERGYKAVNIDGNPNNCNYHNIIFIDPNKEY